MQLPAWAREVLGREYLPPLPQALALQIPALGQVTRCNWCDIREESYGWVLELGFAWDEFQSWGLSWTEAQAHPHDVQLQRLMR